MTPDEVEQRAWDQMQALTADEVEQHPLVKQYVEFSSFELDLWDKRIYLRDIFYNELWNEVKPLR